MTDLIVVLLCAVVVFVVTAVRVRAENRDED